MRKLILLILFFHLDSVVYNQTIRGTILDRQTDSTILYASIYFNGTFVGTISDVDGNFELDISKYISMPITISATGYYSVTLADFSSNQPLKIYLNPKAIRLDEVNIKAKSLVRQRKANLKIFTNEFLGTTRNAKKCIILNENDIKFDYHSDGDTLRAYASKPIIIDNRALGYRVTYFLDNFEHDRKNRTTFFYGNIIFDEELSDEATKEFLEFKRKKTYLGSRGHFLRSLWTDNLKLNEFTVNSHNTKNLKYEEIVSEDGDNTKFISYPEFLEIVYHNFISYLEFCEKYVYFEANGYFDPSGVKWRGEMANQRIADWLPYEYEPQ
ncbi:MAG: hypothetical protein CVU00_11490 [Bacteroidetes bacterium HGW-Bacteroidetes-17]|jgi:hypothetical protein|nr:MAG: hypothetical protein CVU00_11490 [Bacteroidetes bacterium HGW-Bacteroidetes-17]